MTISIFDLFSIGIGPSSSHTVGPMSAACEFVDMLAQNNQLASVKRIKIDLYGSLALTGIGHGTDKAVLNGLEGQRPERVDPDTLIPRMENIKTEQRILLNGNHSIAFDYTKDMNWDQKTFLEKHSNAMKFSVFSDDDRCIVEEIYYSIGGGFIVTDKTFGKDTDASALPQPYPFSTGDQLIELTQKHQLSIADIMLKNELAWRSEDEIIERIKLITTIMSECIEKGCQTKGQLPGGLNVTRRAAELFNVLERKGSIHSVGETTDVLNYLNMYAMAVNEENAAGGRIVTAPTNGAAGIIPAVIEYYKNFHDGADFAGVVKFFLTAGAIAILYKKQASISGAEVGCQGEVGVASSMAAAGLAAALGGTSLQIENAAEIAMEHHLGMTCDPVNGLVQIPCIERNAMGAVKAVNATRMALIGNGEHKVSLDKVINTMRQTGHDMMTIYKETSQGGLAVNVPEC